MKFNNIKNSLKSKGIKFNTWLIFTVFASIILIVFWVLQMSLMQPYYRNAKINSVTTISDNIESMIYSGQPLTMVDKIARDNSLCIQIVDSYGNITPFNALGSGCYLTKFTDDEFTTLYENIVTSPNLEYNYFVDYDSEMIIYGRMISPHLGNYVLLINANITPERVGLVLIQNQFVTLTIGVLLFATLASLLIAKYIEKPFVKMTESAKDLAKGDLNVSFDDDGIYFMELSELSDALNFATVKLKEIDDLRIDLIANVSHDIKTPLTMILAYIEMINDFSKDNETLLLEHLDVINSEAKYLDLLVDNMLVLSMVQTGNIELQETEFSLNDLAIETARRFQSDVKVYGDVEYNVKGDRIKLGQVIYNFINNAIQHASADTIYVNIEGIDDRVRLSVIDNGKGISNEDKSNIWNRYFKIDKNFERDISHSGLGLSISKGIIDAHHGVIDVNSDIDNGSEFYFEIEYLTEGRDEILHEDKRELE